MRKYFNFQMFEETTISEALTMKAWSKQLYKEAETESFFARFTGEDSNSIIQKKTDLRKEKGDSITFGLVMKLEGDGILGDNILEGNEEKLNILDCTVKVDQIRNGIKLAGSLTEQKAALDLRTSAKGALKGWLAEKNEKDTFAALTKDPTPNRVYYAGGRTAVNAITASDTLSTAVISAARRKAKLAKPKVRPVNVNGKNWYVMVVDSYQARDLKNDPNWIAAQKDANLRGENNPIFTGALGYYDGVILHEHENIIRTADGAGGVYVGHALLMGAQAGVYAVAKEPTWKEESFDYGDKVGFATGMIRGIEKATFTDENDEKFDFGVVQVITSSVAD